MKQPKQLKIGGHIYKIKYQDRSKIDGNTNLGTSDYYRNMIFIDNTISTSQIETTILHEIIHILNMFNNWGFNETQISQLETGLYQVLKDNKLI